MLACWPVRNVVAAPVEWKLADGGNGHYYDQIDSQVTWPEARLAAGTSWLGTTGHLLTVTSQAELDFVQANLSHRSNLWLGGYQDLSAPDYSEPAGGWRWLTNEPFQFTAWSTTAVGGNDDEPNNAGPEHVMSSELSNFNGNTILRFNDAQESQFFNGYYVEYLSPGIPRLGETIATDVTWRRPRQVGNLEGQPIAVAGLAWEAINPGWNNSLAFDDSGWGNPVPQPDTWDPTNTISPHVVWANGSDTPIYLRKEFEINGTPTSGTLDFGVDDDAQIFINGTLAANDDQGGATYRPGIDVGSLLVPGTNLIAAWALALVAVACLFIHRSRRRLLPALRRSGCDRSSY